MADFNLFLPLLLENEGSQVVENDQGRGVSKYGWTYMTLKQLMPGVTPDDIRNMTPETAGQLYKKYFWDQNRFGSIASQAVANKVCDLSVDLGPGAAIRLLQAAVGLPVSMQTGYFGAITCVRVNAQADGDVLLGSFVYENGVVTGTGYRGIVAQWYVDDVKKNPAKAPELPGWLARLAK